MSYEETLRSISLDADSSLGIYTGVPGQPGSAVPNTGMQYRGIKLTGAHQVGLATAASDIIVGIIQNKPQRAGEPATVGISGVTNVMSGAAFAAGVEIVVDGTSRFIAGATTGHGRKLISLGVSSGAGQLVPAMLI